MSCENKRTPKETSVDATGLEVTDDLAPDPQFQRVWQLGLPIPPESWQIMSQTTRDLLAGQVDNDMRGIPSPPSEQPDRSGQMEGGRPIHS